MLEYGLNTLTKTGRNVMVIADGDFRGMKSGGITLDLTTVPASGTSTITLTDDSVVPPGANYMRFGQVVTKITASGKFGPYDPAASDGRQTLVRGECFVLNRTWIDNTAGAGMLQGTSHPAVFDTGRVWKERILQSGTVTGTLALGPTLANFNTAFPGISYVEN